MGLLEQWSLPVDMRERLGLHEEWPSAGLLALRASRLWPTGVRTVIAHHKMDSMDDDTQVSQRRRHT